MAKNEQRTNLVFQKDGDLVQLSVHVKSVVPLTEISEADQSLFKSDGAVQQIHVVVTDETIFHPQGGGQPSDEGTMTNNGKTFTVLSARMGADVNTDGQALHFGHFDQDPFVSGDVVEQKIDAEKRLLYSRYHTAGHVLGTAVRQLLEKEVPNFDELKASHFPGSAACEFQGSIEGKYKAAIQLKVDDFTKQDLPVEIDWWDEEDFRREGLERLIPATKIEGEKWRVVKIVGAEIYPCGGTHVHTTSKCGKTNVKKISRSKGNSRVSYDVA